MRTVVNVTRMKYALIVHSLFDPLLISSDAGSRSELGISDVQVAGNLKITILENRKFDKNGPND